MLTGGASRLSGLLELASERLPRPVRMGYPQGLSGRTEALRGPEFATVCGILMWAARHRRPNQWHEERLAGLKRFFRKLAAPKETEFVLRYPQQFSHNGFPVEAVEPNTEGMSHVLT